MIWAIENPNAGVVEPEDIDERRILEISTPYLGTMAGYWTNWTPLQDRETLFPEDLDRNEPWAFKNVIVR
jgi:homospermidine synthase